MFMDKRKIKGIIEAKKRGSRKHFDFISKKSYSDSERVRIAKLNDIPYKPKP